MYEQHKPSIARTLTSAALFLVIAGLAWPHVALWYDSAIATLAGPFAPAGVSIQASGNSVVLSSKESGGVFFIEGLVLGLGLIVPLVVVVTTPSMRILMRSCSALGLALLVGLSQVSILVYLAHNTTPRNSTDIFIIFSVYWMIFPGIIAALWCYFLWFPRLLRAT